MYCPVRGRAVRADRGDEARALAADPRPEPPGHDVRETAQPEVEGRHRLGRVLPDRGERLHVVRLERRHVPLEQLAVGPFQLRRREIRSDVGRSKRGPGPLERTSDRSDARLEELGHLRRLPTKHLAEHEHGALPAGGAGGRQRTRAGSSRGRRRHRPGLRPARRAPSGSAGSRSLPAASAGSTRSARGPGRGPSAARAVRDQSQHVEAHVRRDAVEPRRRLALPRSAPWLGPDGCPGRGSAAALQSSCRGRCGRDCERARFS